MALVILSQPFNMLKIGSFHSSVASYDIKINWVMSQNENSIQRKKKKAKKSRCSYRRHYYISQELPTLRMGEKMRGQGREKGNERKRETETETGMRNPKWRNSYMVRASIKVGT